MKNVHSILLVLVLAVAAQAENNAEAGRRTLKANEGAVISTRLVVSYNVTMGGRDQQGESKSEAVGVIVDPSGLTLISLSAIDPSAILRAQSRGVRDMSVEATVKDAKLVLADGTEVPAEVALRDKDLDIAFLRPIEKPAKPLPAVDLNKAAKPQVLDEVICLNRLGKIANRVVAVSPAHIAAVVERPRAFYIISGSSAVGVGSAVFSQTGAPVGIIMIRNVQSEGATAMLPIIIPAADILDDAKQALETKKTPPSESK